MRGAQNLARIGRAKRLKHRFDRLGMNTILGLLDEIHAMVDIEVRQQRQCEHAKRSVGNGPAWSGETSVIHDSEVAMKVLRPLDSVDLSDMWKRRLDVTDPSG